ncbi:MAG: hypothetical protein U1B77_04015, partial [Dehalococcoidales bacterium]|nr:hypothetical protein [Dehalococcoidales bacterium]
VPVNVTVIMRAIASWRGVTLIDDTPIKPSKTVSPGTITAGQTLTYTIRLEQISATSERLDAVYDILPSYTSASGGAPYYDYVPGSSRLRVDGGDWQQIDDPGIVKDGSNLRLKWPATYNYSNGTGGFPSPMRDFANGQIKEIRFEVKPSNLSPNTTYYNWVVLKPWNTLSGAAAPVVTGTGAGSSDGLLAVAKISDKDFVPPGVPTEVVYTISIENLQGSNNSVNSLTDYLPPEFSYVDGTTNSDLVSGNPAKVFEEINGVNRWALTWIPPSSTKSIAANTTKTVTFTAVTSENVSVSGSYYNEVTVNFSSSLPSAFSNIGITREDFSSGYSWNSAPVIVPAYDSSASSGDITSNANIAITTGSVAITSYQVQ